MVLKSLYQKVLPLNMRRKFRGFRKSIEYAPSTFSALWNRSNNLRLKYRSINKIDDLLMKHIDISKNVGISLDLGCGKKPSNPFNAFKTYGVDMLEDTDLNVKKANLSKQDIPFPDNNFEYVTAVYFLGHIPRILDIAGENTFPFINLMNEIYRVLKPNGYFLHKSPGFPSVEAFSDPTQVNFITEDTFPYFFCAPFEWASKLGYGFNGHFELVGQNWLGNEAMGNGNSHIVSLIRAIK